MKRPVRTVAVLVLALLVGCGGGGETDPGSSSGKPVVVATNVPIQYFAERLGGDAVKVESYVPNGVDPTSWQPSDDDVLAMQKADAVLLNGAQFSGWIRRVSLPDVILVDTSRRFADRYVVVDDFEVHRHGSEGEHSHAGTAPNTFLDPALAFQQAEMVRNTLISLVPEQKQAFEERFDKLAAELRVIDDAYKSLLDDVPKTPVFASHPFCNYVGRRANWDIVHLHWKPDADPGPEKWETVEEKIIDHPARWMLFSKPPTAAVEARLAELGIAIAVIDPAITLPDDGDFLDTLRANLETVRKVVQNERPTGPLPTDS